MSTNLRLFVLLVAGLFGLSVAASLPAGAVGTDTPSAPPAPAAKPDKPKAPAKAKKKKAPKKDDKKAEEKFLEGYSVAYNLIYKQNDYLAGIAKLQSLGRDDHADVANLIGFSSRKLGRYDDAKLWYEKALAADPKHARTWSYYGMWHAEQGNALKARDFLAKVETLCGTGCKEYVELKGVIEGTGVY
jgi:tetratricopeptide (TPR) repeat protein